MVGPLGPEAGGDGIVECERLAVSYALEDGAPVVGREGGGLLMPTLTLSLTPFLRTDASAGIIHKASSGKLSRGWVGGKVGGAGHIWL